MRKIHILLISAVLLIPSLFGAWVAEPDFIQNLQLKLDLFYKVNRPAKIYMTFNQPKYAAGDTAFFTLHLRLGPDQAPVSGKQIINLRLVDLNQTLLLYNRIACDNGVVNGQLIFPGDLPPDIYTLIAYSDEMAQRQVLPSYFHRSIIISGEKEFLPVQNKDIQLFPEGGTLVAGLENKVVVSTTQKESVASVITESGGKITDFKISRGLGKFLITPQSGEQYFIEVDGERKKLPESGNDGIVMRVTTAENKESMQVIMQSKSTSKWSVSIKLMSLK